MYTREEFDVVRLRARDAERRASAVMAVLAVSLGVGQLAFIRWADTHMARGDAVPLEVTFFLVYMALLAVLVVRFERGRRSRAPHCPHCRRPLLRLSERVAVATGRCDACGGQVIA